MKIMDYLTEINRAFSQRHLTGAVKSELFSRCVVQPSWYALLQGFPIGGPRTPRDP